jgi:hypothetical protein
MSRKKRNKALKAAKNLSHQSATINMALIKARLVTNHLAKKHHLCESNEKGFYKTEKIEKSFGISL